MMQKFQGESGDGLGALGLKRRPNGSYELVSVDTVVRGDAPFLRKAGMGGARYMRHCLESAILQRGGLWMPETIEQAFNILEKLDGGSVAEARFETWVYVLDGNAVTRQAVEPSVPQPGTCLQHRKFVEKHIDWPALFHKTARRARDEVGRASLRALWVDRYDGTLARYVQSSASDGELLCALLAQQAETERTFLAETGSLGVFATEPFRKMIAARYVRTLCQFDLSADKPTVSNPLSPDLTEVGRTILLLCAAGRVPEAFEIGARVEPYIDRDLLFVPTIACFGLAIATGQDNLLDLENDSSGTTLRRDCKDVLLHLRGAASVDLDMAVERIIDGRARQMGGFSDEYHIDFDDELSWAMPYEANAIIALCRHFSRALPSTDHPAFGLPSAQIPDLSNAPLSFQDVYAAFLERRA